MLNKYPQVILIGTTNNLKDIDKPLQTRFSADTIKMNIEHSYELRKKIFLTHLKEIPYVLSDDHFKTVLNAAKNFSVREIESLVRWAFTCAYDRNAEVVAQEDFVLAVERVETGRTDIKNAEPWTDFGLRKTKEFGNQMFNGAGIIAGGSIFSAVFLSESVREAGKNLINIENIKTIFQKIMVRS